MFYLWFLNKTMKSEKTYGMSLNYLQNEVQISLDLESKMK